MAVKIRLTRIGKKRQPSYRVVVADSRSPRDGAYIEQIGRYDPRQEPSIVEIDNERASYWIAKGAQPSSQVRKLLEISGAAPARPMLDARIHVVGEAEPQAAAVDDADAVAAPQAVTEKVVDIVEDAANETATLPESPDDAGEEEA
jgi:small subunit ribosomal protein S16